MHTMQVIMQSKDKKIKTPILNPKKMLRKFVLFFFCYISLLFDSNLTHK